MQTRAAPASKFSQVSKAGNRYGNTYHSIVASARNEVDQNYQSSALPRTRLSMDLRANAIGSQSIAKGFLAPGGKLSVGLPPMRKDGAAAVSMQLSASKSFNMSGGERVSLYRNEEDRQTMMK